MKFYCNDCKQSFTPPADPAALHPHQFHDTKILG